ncbi:MAG: hypothetical protein LBJ46_06825 [Planctomycetota bacterium]|nr:hypothetical protein [Planctomycetota bacterium]
MVKKLGGFFAIIGLMVFLGSWAYHRLVNKATADLAMPPEQAWEVGIYLTVSFLFLGFFVSTLGIALVQEVMAERRGREMEKKYRAKSRYDMALSQGEKGA